jgi:hypothetical protein
MDENLERLASELRRERCPKRVLDEVSRRIAKEARPQPRLKIAAVVAGAAVLCAILLWMRPVGPDTHGQPRAGAPPSADSARAAQEAKLALGCIGTVLRDAGARSEEAILKGAVPPLRNSLQTVKNKLENQYKTL